MEEGFAQKRKQLALEMAQFLYDIYKEQEADKADIIKDGRNNVQEQESNY